MTLISIGFGSLLSLERVIAVVSPDSAPVKRLVQENRERGLLIDATYGHKTASVFIMDSGHVILSALPPEKFRDMPGTAENTGESAHMSGPVHKTGEYTSTSGPVHKTGEYTNTSGPVHKTGEYTNTSGPVHRTGESANRSGTAQTRRDYG